MRYGLTLKDLLKVQIAKILCYRPLFSFAIFAALRDRFFLVPL